MCTGKWPFDRSKNTFFPPSFFHVMTVIIRNIKTSFPAFCLLALLHCAFLRPFFAVSVGLGWIEGGETHASVSPLRLYSPTVADEKKQEEGKIKWGVHYGIKWVCMVEKRAKIQDQVNEPILGGIRKRGGGQTHADEILFFFPLYFWELGCDSLPFHKGLQRIKEIEFGIKADEKKKHWRVIYGRARHVSCPNAEQRKDCTVQ